MSETRVGTGGRGVPGQFSISSKQLGTAECKAAVMNGMIGLSSEGHLQRGSDTRSVRKSNFQARGEYTHLGIARFAKIPSFKAKPTHPNSLPECGRDSPGERTHSVPKLGASSVTMISLTRAQRSGRERKKRIFPSRLSHHVRIITILSRWDTRGCTVSASSWFI